MTVESVGSESRTVNAKASEPESPSYNQTSSIRNVGGGTAGDSRAHETNPTARSVRMRTRADGEIRKCARGSQGNGLPWLGAIAETGHEADANLRTRSFHFTPTDV